MSLTIVIFFVTKHLNTKSRCIERVDKDQGQGYSSKNYVKNATISLQLFQHVYFKGQLFCVEIFRSITVQLLFHCRIRVRVYRGVDTLTFSEYFHINFEMANVSVCFDNYEKEYPFFYVHQNSHLQKQERADFMKYLVKASIIIPLIRGVRFFIEEGEQKCVVCNLA